MCCGARVLVLAVLGLLVEPSVAAPDKKFNITIGYLPSIRCGFLARQGPTISGALSMALEEVNNGTDLLPDVKLLLEWRDTRCDTAVATQMLAEMASSGVVAFFGPEGRCYTEAIVAESRNLPMISYKCSDYQTSTLSNFIRLEPPDTQATKFVIALLKYYRWTKFSILYEEPWVTVALTLENHAKKSNMTVNHQRPVIDVFKCCEENMACCAPGFWYQFIQETKNRTRIYVFLGSTAGLIDMMTAMESLQLFAKGEYMVIFVDMLTYSPEESMKYLIKTEDRGTTLACSKTNELPFKKRAQSLLVVVSSEPEGSYELFTSRVRDYNSMKPFEFPLPAVFEKRFIKFVPIYAAYLYDSVKLYATALHKVIEEETTYKNETLTEKKLLKIATNGSRIVSKMIQITPFKSVTGRYIRLDEQANSEGDFSVLAFKNIEDNKCNASMVPVGHFQQNIGKKIPVFNLNPRSQVEWADGVRPEAEPSCGFLNEKCPKGESLITTQVWMAHQKSSAFNKKNEELRVQCKMEQELHGNRALLIKDSIDHNSMHEHEPPGVKA